MRDETKRTALSKLVRDFCRASPLRGFRIVSHAGTPLAADADLEREASPSETPAETRIPSSPAAAAD